MARYLGHGAQQPWETATLLISHCAVANELNIKDTSDLKSCCGRYEPGTQAWTMNSDSVREYG